MSLYSSTELLSVFDASPRAKTSPRAGEIDCARRRRRVHEPELDRPLDRLAPARRVELAVDRDRLRLDGVAGDEEPLGDLPEREVGGQQGQQAKLGRSERGCPARRLRRRPSRASLARPRPPPRACRASGADEGCRPPRGRASPRRVRPTGPDAPSRARAEPAPRTRTERASSSGACAGRSRASSGLARPAPWRLRASP